MQIPVERLVGTMQETYSDSYRDDLVAQTRNFRQELRNYRGDNDATVMGEVSLSLSLSRFPPSWRDYWHADIEKSTSTYSFDTLLEIFVFASNISREISILWIIEYFWKLCNVIPMLKREPFGKYPKQNYRHNWKVCACKNNARLCLSLFIKRITFSAFALKFININHIVKKRQASSWKSQGSNILNRARRLLINPS